MISGIGSNLQTTYYTRNLLNNPKNITFGYNKELNKKLKEVLSNDKTITSTQLIEDIDEMNSMEDELKKSESRMKEYQPGILSFKDLTDGAIYEGKLGDFLNSKFIVTALVELSHPELNYAKTESETYKQEFDKNTKSQRRSRLFASLGLLSMISRQRTKGAKTEEDDEFMKAAKREVEEFLSNSH